VGIGIENSKCNEREENQVIYSARQKYEKIVFFVSFQFLWMQGISRPVEKRDKLP